MKSVYMVTKNIILLSEKPDSPATVGREGREFTSCHYYYLYQKNGTKSTMMPSVLSVTKYNAIAAVPFCRVVSSNLLPLPLFVHKPFQQL